MCSITKQNYHINMKKLLKMIAALRKSKSKITRITHFLALLASCLIQNNNF